MPNIKKWFWMLFLYESDCLLLKSDILPLNTSVLLWATMLPFLEHKGSCYNCVPHICSAVMSMVYTTLVVNYNSFGLRVSTPLCCNTKC